MTNQSTANQLLEIALRIRDMREILGYSMQRMAELTEVSDDMYKLYESGPVDLKAAVEELTTYAIPKLFSED